MTPHHPARQREIPGHHPPQTLRIQPLPQSRRARHITEQHRHRLTLLAHNLRSNERRSALHAELRAVRVIVSAGRTGCHQRSLDPRRRQCTSGSVGRDRETGLSMATTSPGLLEPRGSFAAGVGGPCPERPGSANRVDPSSSMVATRWPPSRRPASALGLRVDRLVRLQAATVTVLVSRRHVHLKLFESAGVSSSRRLTREPCCRRVGCEPAPGLLDRRPRSWPRRTPHAQPARAVTRDQAGELEQLPGYSTRCPSVRPVASCPLLGFQPAGV
jgi:hypothetical protein